MQTLDVDDDKGKTPNNNCFDFLKLSVTFTIISISLPKFVTATIVKGKKWAPKIVEALSMEETKEGIKEGFGVEAS